MTNAPKHLVFKLSRYVESDGGACYEHGPIRFCVRRAQTACPSPWTYTANRLPVDFPPFDAWEAEA